MFDKQSFLNKLSLRFKIISAIILSLLVSFIIFTNWHPKQNDIPILPLSLRVELHQDQAGELAVRSISIQDRYPQDYQLNLESNYYTIELKTGATTLFTGKMISSYTIVNEEFMKEPEDSKKTTNNSPAAGAYFTIQDPAEGFSTGETTDIPLDDFELNLPYFNNAEEIVISDEYGEEKLRVTLKDYDLQLPAETKKLCGDGICSDDENILFCREDCSY